MRPKNYSTVEVFQTYKLEWNCLLLTGPKKNQRYLCLLLIIQFLSQLCNIFSKINSAEGVLPNDEF